jgi:hypothetical protein
MGTWDASSFGNDTTGDWSYGLAKVGDLSHIESALDRVLGAGSGTAVTIDDAQAAVAAAEVLARLKGNWGEEDPYSEMADNWVRSHPIVPPPAILAKASAALQRILAPPSDLLEEWDEADEAGAWTESIMELKHRVES